MRRLTLSLALLAGALSSCGGGHPGSAAPSGAATARQGSTATGRSLDRAQAQALASALNLRASDVPGFAARARHTRGTPAERKLEREAARCAGGADARGPLAEARSPDFERGRGIVSLSVSSEVSVARSDADAQRELERLRGARARSCVARFFTRLLRGASVRGMRFGAVSVAHGTPPAPGASGSFALRVTTSASVSSLSALKLPLYFDVLGFVRGAVSVTLIATGLPAPVPAPIEERLFSLLLARGDAAGSRVGRSRSRTPPSSSVRPSHTPGSSSAISLSPSALRSGARANATSAPSSRNRSPASWPRA